MNNLFMSYESRSRDITPEEARAKLKQMAEEGDGTVDAGEYAEWLGIEVIQGDVANTTEKQPAVMKVDGTGEFELYVNGHVDTELVLKAIRPIFKQFILDKEVIVEAGVFPKPEQPDRAK